MENDIFFSSATKLPFMIISSDKIIDCNQLFTNLTGFTDEDLRLKSIAQIFSMLKVSPFIDIINIDKEADYFLFTKDLEVRFVNIEVLKESEKDIYVFLEKPCSRLENRFCVIEKMMIENHEGIGIYSSPDLILLKANQCYLDLMDEPYNNKHVTLGLKISDFLPWWKGSEADEVFANVINKAETFYGKEIKGLTGAWKDSYCDNTIVPVIEDGKVRFVISIVEDVTERVITRKKNEEQNKKLESVLKNITDGIFILHKDNKLELLNEGAKEFFYNPYSIKKKGDSLRNTKYFDSDGNEIALEDLPGPRTLRGEDVEQFRLKAVRPDKTIYFNISGSPIYDESGSISSAVVCFSDITEQVKYEEILKTQRDYLYNLIYTLDFPTIRLSYPDYNIINVNKMCYDFISQLLKGSIPEHEAIVGKNICELFPEFMGKSNCQVLNRIETSKNPVYLKNIQFMLDGREKYINFLYQPVLGLNGDIQELIVILIDVTDEILQKKAVEKTMKMQEEFFSFIAHEFRTPLNTMSSAIQFMELIYNDEMSQNIKKNISTIKRNTYQQMRLVNSLLDITKAEAGYLKVHKKNSDIVTMTKVIADSIIPYAREKGVNVKFSSTTLQKVVAIDDEKYERILLNLLSNAIKFTPNGKSIFIDVSYGHENVYIKIKDEGVGIPKDKQGVIFERFGQVGNSLTRQSEGTGIGLCLVKLLVKSLDGEITVESDEGKGSTFTIILPDKKVPSCEDIGLPEFIDGRLVRAVNTEFSSIYYDN